MKKIYTLFIILTVLTASVRLHGQSNYFPPTGNVGIGTLNPAEALTVTGNIQMSHSKRFGYRLFETFTYDSKPQPYYGMQWILDSQDSDGAMLWMGAYGGIKFFTGSSVRMRIDRFGNVGIGTTTPTHKLQVAGSGKWTGNASSYTEINSSTHGQYLRQFSNNGTSVSWVIRGYSSYAGEPQAEFNSGGINVNGTVKAKEVNITATGWADHVFDPEYRLMDLGSLKKFLEQNGHLPGIPTEKEVALNGVNMGEINVKLLEKIEELTLYILQQEQRSDGQMKLINDQQKRLDIMEAKMDLQGN